MPAPWAFIAGLLYGALGVAALAWLILRQDPWRR